MEGEHRGEREANAQGSRFILPEDGYEWKKYGQKFIKSISKNRNYFKCRKSDCFARKKVEWSTLEAGSIRPVYEGVHNHALPARESCSLRSRNPSSSANQYNLWTQVFRHQSEMEAGPFAPATMTAEAYHALLFLLRPPASFRAFPHEFPTCEVPQAASMVPLCEFPQAATMLPPYEFPQAPCNQNFPELVSPVFPQDDSNSNHMAPLREFPQPATMLRPYEFPQAPCNQNFPELVSPVFPQDDSNSNHMAPLCEFPQPATMLRPYEFPQAPCNQNFPELVSPVFPQDDSNSNHMTALQTDDGPDADHALYSDIPLELYAWETNFPNMTLNGANTAAGDVAATSAAPSLPPM